MKMIKSRAMNRMGRKYDIPSVVAPWQRTAIKCAEPGTRYMTISIKEGISDVPRLDPLQREFRQKKLKWLESLHFFLYLFVLHMSFFFGNEAHCAYRILLSKQSSALTKNHELHSISEMALDG